MKYILICTFAMISCFFLGYLIARGVQKMKITKINRLGTILISVGGATLLMIAVSLVYFSVYYKRAGIELPNRFPVVKIG